MKNVNNFVKIAIFGFTLLHAVASTPRLYKATDGRDYLVETSYQYNWYQAGNECARRGYQLVTIDSDSKNHVVIELLKKVIRKSHNVWLGGNDEYSTSRDLKRPFFWSSTGEKFNFTYWSENSPDNYQNNEHCVHIWEAKPLFQWNDNDCTVQLGFICEVNHYFENYQKEVQGKCDAVKHTTSSIASEFSNSCQEQALELDNQNKLIDNLKDRSMGELQLLQNNLRFQIYSVLSEQVVKMTQFAEKVFQKLGALQSELQKSTANINTQFSAKLSEKQNEINEVC